MATGTQLPIPKVELRGSGGAWRVVSAVIAPDLLNVYLIALVLGFAVYQAVKAGGVQLGGGSSPTSQVQDLIWFGLICGFASFATIETLKRLGGLRGFYQRRQASRWLRERSRLAGLDANAVFAQLLDAMGLARQITSSRPTTDGRVTRATERRVFNLPTEQLAAQVSSAVDVALTAPGRYGQLLSCLSGDLPQALTANGPRDDFSTQILARRLRAGIDQFQISLGERWRRYVQGGALWIAGAFGIGLTHAAELPQRSEPRYVLSALLLGGVSAWIFRDVVAVVERSRR
jgi:hypothetical protein